MPNCWPESLGALESVVVSDWTRGTDLVVALSAVGNWCQTVKKAPARTPVHGPLTPLAILTCPPPPPQVLRSCHITFLPVFPLPSVSFFPLPSVSFFPYPFLKIRVRPFYPNMPMTFPLKQNVNTTMPMPPLQHSPFIPPLFLSHPPIPTFLIPFSALSPSPLPSSSCPVLFFPFPPFSDTFASSFLIAPPHRQIPHRNTPSGHLADYAIAIMNTPRVGHWGEYFSSSLYFVVPIIGVCLNAYVLYKLRRISRSNTFRFETSSALPLWAMSICDSICLLALFAQALFHLSVKFHQSTELEPVPDETVALASLFCKANLYTIHATSGFSVWCWLLLSILRYTAVFHPLRYIRIWRQPRNALLWLALSCSLLELWIPSIVIYQPDFASCYENTNYDLSFRQTAHLLDITFAYVVPTLIRILLDGVVLCYCYLPNVQEVPVTQRRYGISAPSSVPASATSLMEQPNRHRKHPKLSVVVSISRQPIIYQHPEIFRRKKSMIKRSLIISAINLCCNLPAHALRTIWTLDSAEQLIPERYLLVLEAVSQLLYFAQFTCNALYLSTTIYETSTYPSTYRTCIARSNNGSNRATKVDRDCNSTAAKEPQAV